MKVCLNCGFIRNTDKATMCNQCRSTNLEQVARSSTESPARTSVESLKTVDRETLQKLAVQWLLSQPGHMGTGREFKEFMGGEVTSRHPRLTELSQVHVVRRLSEKRKNQATNKLAYLYQLSPQLHRASTDPVFAGDFTELSSMEDAVEELREIIHEIQSTWRWKQEDIHLRAVALYGKEGA